MLAGGSVSGMDGRMKNCALIFIGGGLGSVLRHGTVLAAQRLLGPAVFPWGILAANVLGSFALGFLFSWPALRSERPEAWLFCATGVLGGYTTFSTLSNDTVALLARGHGWLALGNGLGSLILGVLAAALGWQLARAIAP